MLNSLPKKQREKKRIYYRKDIKKLKEINLSDSEDEVDLKMRLLSCLGLTRLT